MKTYVVYLIKENGVIRYVGKTVDFNRRKREHLRIKGKKLSSIPMEVNLSTVSFEVLAHCDDINQALQLEDKYILQYDTIANGWNRNRSGLISTNKHDYNKYYYMEHREVIGKQTKEYKKNHQEYYKEYHRIYNKEYYKTHKKCNLWMNKA